MNMTKNIAEDWLNAISASVKSRDINDHMRLVSKSVRVYGIPSIESLNYQQWLYRRHNEFLHNRLLSLKYKIIRIKNDQQRRLGFEVEEQMMSTSGQVVIISKDILLEREEDDNWRVVEEKIHSWQNMDIGQQSNG